MGVNFIISAESLLARS